MSKMQVTSVKKGRAEEKQKPNEDTHGREGCGGFSGWETLPGCHFLGGPSPMPSLSA